MNTEKDELFAILDQADRNSPEYALALSKLRLLAEAGDLDAAEGFAELSAYPGPCHNAAAAYFWYHIVLSKEGYSTDFVEQDPFYSSYHGPVGDFRNESLVSILVDELGFAQAQTIDVAAQLWISKNS